MSSGGIGSTLTSGIQDIAGILPLLGTEQCSVQVSSALTRGYLYAAASSMSIFGSLGVVSAGFKAFASCFSFRGIEGAKILANMGFEPQGENLSLIMVEAGKENNTGRYIIETRMDELIKELNIDRNRITGVSHKSAAWNLKMIATTALLSALSLTPYIHINLGTNLLNESTRWVFPVLRSTGGFLTATLIQLLIQQRITTLSDQYIVERNQPPDTNSDVESAVKPPGNRKKHQMDARAWLFLFLLFVGIVASVVGYVGCFSVVQNSTSSSGPVSWFCLESGLSVMRLVIWAWNPSKDDAPPLEIILELDKYEHKPLPTSNKDTEDILEYKVLPLTRARDFLKIITSFAGLIEPFSNPELSLYYTLTRKRPSKMSELRKRRTESEDAEKHKTGESDLFITVFDHKERTTRVYTRDNDVDTFYSTKSDAPLVDVGHFLLEVEIDDEIDPKGDPVSSDSINLDSLRKHHESILEHIQYRLGAGDVTTEPYAIENSWTMKLEDTISTLQRLKKEENGDVWKAVVENGKKQERNDESFKLLVCDYFDQSTIERERRLLDEKRVKWIARRMEMITKETKERFQGRKGVEYRVDKQSVEKKLAVKLPEEMMRLRFWEQYMMELLLLYEVKEWEQLFWNKFQAFLVQIGNDRVELKERLTREWRADFWKRLNPQMHAAQKRLADVDTMIGKDYYLLEILGTVGKRWASFIRQYFEGVENPYSMSLSDLRVEMRRRLAPPLHEIRLRIEKEVEDIEFRLKRGSELGRFDQFWDDDTLFECRYSRSKWLRLKQYAPLDIYSHALKGNKNIIHISFSLDCAVDLKQFPIRDLPWVTSISWNLSAIHQGPLFIKSINNDLITFAKDVRPKLDPLSIYIFTDADEFDMHSSHGHGELWDNARVLISFFAPTSGQSLILRLKHSGKDDGPLEVALGSAMMRLNPSTKSSLTIDDITLHPIPGSSEETSDSDHLSFKPGIWNDIFVQFKVTRGAAVEKHGHLLHDIQLLDEAGLGDPRNQILNTG